MADLKTICFDNNCMDIKTGEVYTAGTNITIENGVISAKDTVVSPASANPLMDGTVAVGSSLLYARQDHRHPTDTSRAPLASPGLTGTPTAPTNGTASTSNTQIATTAFVQNAINRRLPKSIIEISKTSALSLANNTEVKEVLWTATATGTLIATVYASFAANTTGRRKLTVYRGTSGTGAAMQIAPSPGGVTSISVTIIIRVASGDAISVGLIQASGGTLSSPSRYMRGLFIPD